MEKINTDQIHESKREIAGSVAAPTEHGQTIASQEACESENVLPY